MDAVAKARREWAVVATHADTAVAQYETLMFDADMHPETLEDYGRRADALRHAQWKAFTRMQLAEWEVG